MAELIKTNWAMPVFLAALLISGCGSAKKATVGLDVDVYLHPSSTDPMDILLQTGIDKRLADSEVTRTGIIHVRVADRIVALSGAVKSQAIKTEAEQIARQTEVTLNGQSIRPKEPINNRIEVQR